MEAVKTLLRRYLKAAWRRRWLGVGIAWAVCALGWIGVSMLPNQYESDARIYVDTNAVLTPLLKDVAVDASPADRLAILRQTLLSRPNIEKLISKTDLELAVNSPSQRDALVNALMNNISVSVHKGDPKEVFWISYTSPRPQMARDVVQTLLTIFTENASSGNRTEMENARIFLEHQIASYEQQLQTLDQKKVALRTAYPALFALAGQITESGVDPDGAIKVKIDNVQGQIQDQTALATEYEKELASTKGPVGTGNRVAAVNPKLAEAEAQLRILQMRYTDSFPDVVAAKQSIQALKSLPAVESAAVQATTNNARDAAELKLVETKAKIASLQRELASLQDEQKKLQKMQKESPTVIAEYTNIDRTYGVLHKSYEELLGRLQAANIGAAADTQADKVQIRVIDPPIVPQFPVGPNRLLFVSGVLLAGIGLGLAVPLLLTQLDQSFWVVEDLRSLGLPVLGGISLLALRRRSASLIAGAGFGLAVLLLIAVYGGLLVKILHLAAVA